MVGRCGAMLVSGRAINFSFTWHRWTSFVSLEVDHCWRHISQIWYVYKSQISFHSFVPGLGVKNKHAPKQFLDSAWSMIRKSKTPSQVSGAFHKKRGTVYSCGIFSKWCWKLETQLNERRRIPHSSGEKTIYLKSPPRFVVSCLEIHHSPRIYYYCFFLKPLFNNSKWLMRTLMVDPEIRAEILL